MIRKQLIFKMSNAAKVCGVLLLCDVSMVSRLLYFRHLLSVCGLAGCNLKLKVKGHGMMLEPPGRSSVWRFSEFAAYDPPRNGNDNELFCGGLRHVVPSILYILEY